MKILSKEGAGMFEYIKSDLSRLVEPTITNFIKYYFFPQGTMFRFQVWFRIMQFVKLNRLLRIFLGPFIYIIYRHYEYKYGIHINSNIPVGKGLCLIHGDGVFLNVRSIGENVTIAQNVTCGVWGGYQPLVIM